MCRMFQFELGPYALPIKMGRRLRMVQIARVCPLCPDVRVGNGDAVLSSARPFMKLVMASSITFQRFATDESLGQCVFSWNTCSRRVVFHA